MLGGEIAHLALADAMLAGAGSFHAECPLDEPVEEALHLPALLVVGGVDERQNMEIAVADMAHDGGEQPYPINVLAGLADASGKGLDGHADIGRQHLGAGLQPTRCPISVVARLPELGPLLGPLCPLQLPSPLG